MDDTFSVGTFLDNAAECSDPKHPWVVEVMQTWIDPDDRTLYYIIKCIESPPFQHGWYFEGEIIITDHYSLDKYFQVRGDYARRSTSTPGFALAH